MKVNSRKCFIEIKSELNSIIRKHAFDVRSI